MLRSCARRRSSAARAEAASPLLRARVRAQALGERVQRCPPRAFEQRDRAGREQDLAHEEGDAATDEGVQHPLGARGGALEGDDEDRGASGLDQGERAVHYSGHHEHGRGGSEHHLRRPRPEDEDEQLADDDADRDADEHLRGLRPPPPNARGERDDGGTRREDGLRVAEYYLGQNPGHARGPRGL